MRIGVVNDASIKGSMIVDYVLTSHKSQVTSQASHVPFQKVSTEYRPRDSLLEPCSLVDNDKVQTDKPTMPHTLTPYPYHIIKPHPFNPIMTILIIICSCLLPNGSCV